MIRTALLIILSLSVASCVSDRERSTQAASSSQPVEVPVIMGTYATASEIAKFSSTVLVIFTNSDDNLRFRQRRSSDIPNGPEEQRGLALADGKTLYLPFVIASANGKDVDVFSSVGRYTAAKINGRDVLLRDDARVAYEERNELYDYGILIRVDERSGYIVDMKEVQHPSIKVLYADNSKPWNDPFVNGPNAR
jgi:hypothetical protein